MAKVLQGAFAFPGLSGDGAAGTGTDLLFSLLGNAQFYPRANPAVGMSAQLTVRGIEDLEHTVSFGGTIRNLTVRARLNDRITEGVITIYKNAVATTMTVTITPSTSGVFHGTGTVTFEAGDSIYGRVELPIQDITDPGYVGEACSVLGVWCEMEADSGHWSIQRATSDRTSDGLFVEGDFTRGNWVDDPYKNTAVGFEFVPVALGGAIGYSAYETLGGFLVPTGNVSNLVIPQATLRSYAQSRVRAPGTYSNMRCYMSNNDGGEILPETADWFLEKNGTATALTVQMVGTQGGSLTPSGTLLVDDANTAAVIATDLLCTGIDTYDAVADGPDPALRVITAGYHRVSSVTYDFQATGVNSDVFLDATSHSGQNQTTGVINAASITGEVAFPLFGTFTYNVSGVFLSGYELVCIQPPFCTRFSNLRINCTQYDGDPIVFAVYVDGVASDVAITVNATGWFEDTTNTVDAGPGQDVSLGYAVASGETFTGLLWGLAFTQAEGDACPLQYQCYKDCPEGMSLPELRGRTLEMLGEDPSSPVYWSADEIDRHVNDTYITAARDTKAIEYVEGIVLTSGEAQASLSDQVGQILRVTWDDYVIPNTTPWELDRGQTHWETQTGYIDRYATDLRDVRKIITYKTWDGTNYDTYGPFVDGAFTYTAWNNATDYVVGDRVTYTGVDGITRAYEAVDVADAVDAVYYEPEVGEFWTDIWVHISLMVWCIKTPAAMTGCDEPELPPWCHLGLAFGAAARALMKEGEQGDPELSAIYAAVAKDYADLLKGYTNNRTPERESRMGGGGSRRGLYRRSPTDQIIG